MKALGIRADVTVAADIDRLVSETARTFRRIDVLVNNAGGARAAEDDDSWQAAYEVNLLAAVRASRAVAPHMRAAGGGSIIHIASIWGREGGGAATYNAMKAAMISHAKNLALALAPDGIRVN